MEKQILNLLIIPLCFYTVNLFGITTDLSKKESDYNPEADTLKIRHLNHSKMPLADVVVNLNRTRYDYDLGTPTSAVLSGWTRISPETSGDISWSVQPNATDRGTASGTNDNNRDFCHNSVATTFRHKIKNGDWEVIMNMGDRTTAHDNMQVVAEGITLTSDLDSPAGSYPYVRGTVTVSDGELTIELSDNGGANPDWVWNRLTLVKQGVLKGTLKDKYGENLRAAPMTFAKRYPGPLIYAQDINTWWTLKDHHYNAVRLNWVGALKSLKPNLDVWDWNELGAEMDKVVANAVATGMTVIIDYHNVGEQDPNKGDGTDYTMNWLEQFWTHIAPRYKDNDHVIYELQNEPSFSLSGYTTASYKTRFLEIYNMVRSLAPNRQLIVFSAPHHNYMDELLIHYEGDLDWDYTSAGHHLYGGGTSNNIKSAANKHRVLCTEWEYDVTDLSYAGPVDGYKEGAETLEKINQSWFDWSTHDGPTLTQGILIPDAISKGYQWWTDTGTTVDFELPGTNDFYYDGDNVTVKINATDNGSIANVKLFLNGIFHSQTASAPYQFTLNNLAAGNYVLRTEVIDNEGNIEPRTRDFSVLPETASSRQILNPTADAFVRNNGTQDGTGATLNAKHAYTASETMKAYMKFDLSNLTGSSIASAKLRVYNTGSNDEGWIFLHELREDDWTEAGITWSNSPKNTGIPAQLRNFRGNENAAETQFTEKEEWVEWDVTKFINQELKIDNGTVSFQLSNLVEIQDRHKNRNKTDQTFTFGSRESSTPPQLILAGISTGEARPNLALNKPAFQSSDNGTHYAPKAVNGSFDDFNHTTSDTNAWWEVDLGVVSDITTIEFYNRLDCCQDRLKNFHVFVSDVPFDSQDLNTTINQSDVSNYHTPGSAEVLSVINVNRTGRYVRIQLAGTNFLHLTEVLVYGQSTLALDLDHEHNSNTLFNVYPNPTSKNINLDLKLSAANKISINVFNMLGQTIYRENIGEFSPGNHTLEYNKDRLKMTTDGIYIIEVTIGDHKAFKKIVLKK